MTNQILDEMRRDFEIMLSEFRLDNLSSPQLIERALILEKSLAASIDNRSDYII